MNLRRLFIDDARIARYDERARRHGLAVGEDSSELGVWPWRYRIYPVDEHEPGELTARHLKAFQASAFLDLLDHIAPND
jgi:hypothetical protein